MPGFAALPALQQQILAEEVQRLFGARHAKEKTEAGSPDATLTVPAIGPSDANSIARGKDIYFQSGCRHCHGDDGTAATAGSMVDEAGRPTTPRDLVRDPMKGGSQTESLYRRIRLGMPGTPHPASPALLESDLVALVHYCQTLGREPKQHLTNSQRAALAAGGRQSLGSTGLKPGQQLP